MKRQREVKIEVSQVFKKDGAQVFFHDLKGPLPERWAGFSLMAQALTQAAMALQGYFALPADERGIQKLALWAFAAIQYGKCFMANEGWKAQLDPRIVLGAEGQKMKRAHAWWMEHRNTFLAHGGVTPAQGYSVAAMYRKETPRRIEAFQAISYSAAAPVDSHLRRLGKLIEISSLWVKKHMAEIEKKMAIGMIEEEGCELSEDLAKAHKIKRGPTVSPLTT